MSDRNIKDLHPDLQPLAQRFLDQCGGKGITAFLTETYRSSEDQDADYAQGRAKPGHIITNARGGESPHNTTDADGNPAACAFDFAIKNDDGTVDWDASDDDWQVAIRIGEGLGLVSGSTFHSIKDSPHMELANWKDL